MPPGRRTRLYSESVAESSELGSLSSYNEIGGNGAQRISEAGAQVPTVSKWGKNKRRRTTGLNLRFDRMLEKVNIMHTSSAKSRHRRAKSSGSSSASSYDMPKTPEDAYTGSQRERLGETFSVIKMGRNNTQDKDDSFTLSEPFPMWLSSTITSLEPRHPLRALIQHSPSGDENPGTSSSNQVNPHLGTLPGNRHDDDSLFAFSLPTRYIKKREIPYVDPLGDEVQDHSPSVIAAPPQELAKSHDSQFAFNIDAIEPTSPAPDRKSNLNCTLDVAQTILKPTSHSEYNTTPFNVADAKQTPTIEPPPFSAPGPFAPTAHSVLCSPLQLSYSGFNHPYTQDVPPQEWADDSNDADVSVSERYVAHLFSTPGPVYNAPRPLYFDSPSEDPLDSDPLQTVYDVAIDYETLDFSWEPFIQKDVSLHQNANTTGSKASESSCYAPVGRTEPRTPPRVIPAGPENIHGLPLSATSPLPYTLDQSSYLTHNSSPLTSRGKRSPTLTESISSFVPAVDILHYPKPKKPEIVFAPTPGIFLSPLQSSQDSKDSLKAHPGNSDRKSHELVDTLQNRVTVQTQDRSDETIENIEGHDGSQASSDSIKSWSELQ